MQLKCGKTSGEQCTHPTSFKFRKLLLQSHVFVLSSFFVVLFSSLYCGELLPAEPDRLPIVLIYCVECLLPVKPKQPSWDHQNLWKQKRGVSYVNCNILTNWLDFLLRSTRLFEVENIFGNLNSSK